MRHWLYFLPHARQSEIGPDGHPRRGGFRRPCRCRAAWGGRTAALETDNPPRLGQEVQRVSTIRSVQHKDRDALGELLFVPGAPVLKSRSVWR